MGMKVPHNSIIVFGYDCDNVKTNNSFWALTVNLFRSVQIVTDIPGFVENKLVIITFLKVKLVD